MFGPWRFELLPDELPPPEPDDGVTEDAELEPAPVGVAVPEGGHGVVGGGGQPQLPPAGVGVDVDGGVEVVVGRGVGGLPWPLFSQVLPSTEFRTPTTSTWLPHTVTGAWIGTWITLPAPIPGELLEPPDAEVEPPPWLSQELPWSRSPMPITSSWLPQMVTGALSGTSMRLPEPTPGEWLEPPDAPVAPLLWLSQELPVTESRIPITSS